MELEFEQFLTSFTTTTLAQLTVISHLDYCNSFLTDLSTSLIISFISILNMSAKEILSKISRTYFFAYNTTMVS